MLTEDGKAINLLGKYVTATLVGGLDREPRQGVCIQDNVEGIIVLQGELGRYECYADAVVVTKVISDTALFIRQIQEKLNRGELP